MLKWEEEIKRRIDNGPNKRLIQIYHIFMHWSPYPNHRPFFLVISLNFTEIHLGSKNIIQAHLYNSVAEYINI